jgi:SAM-dependent methyltransferase
MKSCLITGHIRPVASWGPVSPKARIRCGAMSGGRVQLPRRIQPLARRARRAVHVTSQAPREAPINSAWLRPQVRGSPRSSAMAVDPFGRPSPASVAEGEQLRCNGCPESTRKAGGMPGELDWGAAFASASTGAMSFYDQIMVPRLFEPWAELLLDELKPQPGQAVLDVACGPGTVTRRAALRVGTSGRVTGSDLSPAMLELARSKVSLDSSASIDYVESSADSLGLPDDAFDLVTCQQGLQFFPNKPAALAEMRRVLRVAGRLGIAVWCDIEDCPPFAAIATALGQVLGPGAEAAYRDGPWGLADSASLLQLAEDSGFTNVSVRRRELAVVFEGGPSQLLLTLRAASVATTLAQLSDAEQSALAAAVEEASRPITFGGVVRSHATSHVLTATR